MSKTYLLIFTALVSTSLLAQTVTNPPAAPAIESKPTAATTNAPAKKAAKKKTATKKKASAPRPVTVPLNPGAAVCEANNVNVRGQAKLKSEVVGKLTKGQQVTVLEEVQLKNSGPDEPSAWAKIVLPTNTLVWINTAFIDSASKTVKPKKLNIRSGPGENYSVLGTLKQGDAVKEVSTKEEWTQIEPPADAYAFVAAQFLKQGEAPIVAANTTTTTPEATPPATPTTVTEPPITTTPTEPTTTATTPTTPPPVTEPAPVTTEPSTTTTNTTPVVEDEPPPKRIVQREGIVRGTFSIQAPTRYELISPDNHRTINYLFSDSADLDLSRYKGLRIIITGEEGLDERWRNTPVITIQKIQVLDYGG
jgi:SH3 domain protein